MPKIIFVDELKEEFNDFKDYIEEKKAGGEIEIIHFLPLDNLEEMTREVLALNPDAIITDHMLNEYKTDIPYNVPYTGVDLVSSVLSIRESFPCFVLTSFDDEAIKTSDDVNIVYIKGILHSSEKDTKSKANFLERVETQIMHYKNKIRETEKRILELIKKSEETDLNSYEEHELIELDTIIEKALDRESFIPTRLKESLNTNKITDLINKVEELNRKLNHDGESND